MAETRDLLIEVGTEELPPKSLKLLATAFRNGIRGQLEQHRLQFESIRSYATPRRLAVLISSLDVIEPDQVVQRKGPALAAAFDTDGNATKAAEGFARSCSVAVAELKVQEGAKGAWLAFQQKRAGKATAALVPGVVEHALAALPIPKRMRWGAGKEEFVRPVHWVVALFGQQVIEAEILGVPTGRETRGHRFHHPGPLAIPAPSDYQAVLRDQGYVYADMEQRRALVRQQVEELAAADASRALIDDALLDEVNALVEWPVAIMGAFDPRFLAVPSEALIEAMQAHQKYFPLVDEQGRLQPKFIVVSNIESTDPTQVRAGNERVIRPRFSDAAFFWEQDLKEPLENHLEELKTVVFQKKLGTVYEKTLRVSNIAARIAGQLGLDPVLAARAGLLSKCDLMSQMVTEFPGLQGTMGRYYATAGGEQPEIAASLEEQYLPRHAGDALPATDCGRALAIADKIDTLLGIVAIGQRPTGEKDPFGLRRAALGILRIMIETPLELDLERLLYLAAEILRDKVDAEAAVPDVFEYMMDRLTAYYSDRGIAHDVVEAVTVRKPKRPSDFDRRVRAVAEFRELPEAKGLASANKRIRNILRKAEESYPEFPDIQLLTEPSEKRLAREIERLARQLSPQLDEGSYGPVLRTLAGLGAPVDRFFDDVMVMCDDTSLRKNRLSLLASLQELFLRVADISRLQ